MKISLCSARAYLSRAIASIFANDFRGGGKLPLRTSARKFPYVLQERPIYREYLLQVLQIIFGGGWGELLPLEDLCTQ